LEIGQRDGEDRMKRLGEFRSKFRDCDNKLQVCLSNYKDGEIYELDIDMITDHCIFLRVVSPYEKTGRENDRDTKCKAGNDR